MTDHTKTEHTTETHEDAKPAQDSTRTRTETHHDDAKPAKDTKTTETHDE